MTDGVAAGGAAGGNPSRPVMAWSFGPGDVATLRRALAAHARHQGLRGGDHDDFVLAVHEGVVNVVGHGGGSGWVRLWRAGRLLCCEISDKGPGIPAGCLDQSRMPGHEGVGGRGLWLITQMSDGVSFQSGEEGTVVRLAKIIA